MKERKREGAIVQVAALIVAAVFAIFVPSAPAHAWGGGTVVSGGFLPITGGTLTGPLAVLPSSVPTVVPFSVRTGNTPGGTNDRYVTIGDVGNEYFGVYTATSTGGNHTRIVGMIQPVGIAGLAIVGAPDVTRAPTGSGTACRFSAASAAQSWTPAETGALDGMEACCTNTGANSVTITASAGVFEGAGGAVAQWKTICMDYVTDRWVQRGSISP